MKDFKELYNSPTYIIELGVISGESKERKKNKEGVTNAELLFILENGSPIRHIPKRPVLKMTIDYVNEQLFSKIIDKGIARFLKEGTSGLEQELKKYCMRIQSYARKIIYDNDGRLEANAESTIKRKGFNHPLFMTGQLARSITCILINDKGIKI